MGYSEHKAYHDNLKTGYWADEDPAYCPCRGFGWMLSNIDTNHKCPFHFDGQPHPEMDFPEDYDSEPASGPFPEVVEMERKRREDQERFADIPF